MLSEMLPACPRCGAYLSSGESCRDRFDLCLALEYENPTTYGTVHHLTVACYMLQHNDYSRSGWLEARQMLAEFIQQGITPADVRKRNHSKLDSRNRKWSVSKGAKLSEVEAIVWSGTVGDVRLDEPENYCADIKLWATTVLADTTTFMQEMDL